MSAPVRVRAVKSNKGTDNGLVEVADGFVRGVGVLGNSAPARLPAWVPWVSEHLPGRLPGCLRASSTLGAEEPRRPSGARARPSQALVGLECDPPGQQCLSECLGVSRRRSACLGGARTRRGMRRPAGHSRQSQQPLNRASRRVPGAQDTTAPGAWPPRAALRVSVPARLTVAVPRPPTLPTVP